MLIESWSESEPRLTPAATADNALNLVGQRNAELEELVRVGVGLCLGVDAKDRFGAGAAEHEPRTILRNILHTVEAFHFGERRAEESRSPSLLAARCSPFKNHPCA